MINITGEILTNIPNPCACNACNIKKPSKYYRKTGFSLNQSPANNYFNQRKIQQVTGVSASQYVSILNVLNTQPIPPNGLKYQRNLSDRNQPSVGKPFTPWGLNRLAWNSPAGLNSAGVGGDIKGFSYSRYLNRLKQGIVTRDPYPTSNSNEKVKTGISTLQYAKCCNDNSIIPPNYTYQVYTQYFVGQIVLWSDPQYACSLVEAIITNVIQYDTVQLQLYNSADTTIHTVSIWNIQPITNSSTYLSDTSVEVNVCSGCDKSDPRTYLINSLNANGVNYTFN
jgi:hypothetical protein